MRLTPILLLTALLALASGARRNSKKGRKNCRLPGCSVCNKSDRTMCDVCLNGWAKNGENNKCERCGANCKTCASAG